MNFGKAIEAMKRGEKVARNGWNGKGMFVYLVNGTTVPKSNLRNEAANAIADSPLETIQITSHIDMKAADGSIVVGWLASQTDMLANDWVIVSESKDNPLTITTETFETKEMLITMETLEKHAQNQLDKGLSLSLLIDMPGFDAPELIVNPPENIAKKMDYYRATYDENCNHKHAKGIRIIGYAL